MRLLVFTFSLFFLSGCLCQDDRGCDCDSTDEQCDAERGAKPTIFPVGVYRCESNQSTLDQSKAPLISAGIDVKYSRCADLRTPVSGGGEFCAGGVFTQVDIHYVPYVSRNDALGLTEFNYIDAGYGHGEKPCI